MLRMILGCGLDRMISSCFMGSWPLAKADDDLLARHDCPRASLQVQDTARSFPLFRYHLQTASEKSEDIWKFVWIFHSTAFKNGKMPN